MRRDDDLVVLEQRALSRRLLTEDVQSGAGDAALVESAHQRPFVEQLAAGGVDDPRALLDLGERLFAQQVAAGGRQGDVQRDEVRLLEQLVLGDQLHSQPLRPLRRDVGIVGDDAHFQSARAPRHLRAHLAQADQPQRLAAQLRAEKLLSLPAPSAQ